MGDVRYSVLGPLAVQRNKAPVAVGSELRRRILAALLLTPNSPVPMPQLLVAGWQDAAPDDGPEQLRATIDALRDLVDPHRVPGSDGDLIHLSDDRYMLCAGRADVDRFVFEDTVRSAEAARSRGAQGAAADQLRAGLAQWRGDLLHGMAGPPFADARGRLEETRLQAYEELYEIELGRGLHDEILPDLARYVALHPLREGFRKTFLLALFRTGRRQDAMLQYNEFRHRLQRTEGRTPSYELRQLAHWIALDDVALLRETPTPPSDPVPMPTPGPLLVDHPQAAPMQPFGAVWPPVPAGPPWRTIPPKRGAAPLSVRTPGFGSVVTLGTVRRRTRWHLVLAALYLGLSGASFLLPDGLFLTVICLNVLLLPAGAAHLAVVAASEARGRLNVGQGDG